MTPAEKFQQLVGAPGVVAEIPTCYGARHVPGIPRLGIPTFRITNGPVGVGQSDCVPTTTPNLPRAAMMSTASAKATALPSGMAVAASFDPRRRGAVRRRDRRGDAQPRAARARGTGAQPGARAAGRAQLRVLRRGSLPHRDDGGGRDPRDAEARRDRDGEALHRQRARDESHDGERDRRRPRAARALPAAVRDGGARRQGRVGDVLVQPRERDVHVREPAAAHRGAARAVGIRRLRAVGLLRDAHDGAARSLAGMDHEMPGVALGPLTPWFSAARLQAALDAARDHDGERSTRRWRAGTGRCSGSGSSTGRWRRRRWTSRATRRSRARSASRRPCCSRTTARSSRSMRVA